MTPDQAKSWSAMAFVPNNTIDWANQGFNPREAQRWAFIGINPEESRTLKEARWNPDNVHLWGPFKDWTPEDATSWKSNRFTHVKMKYWLSLNMIITEAQLWQKMGITTQLHKTLENNQITLTQWEQWKHTTSLAEAASWIGNGFTPESASPWMENKVSPTDAKKLRGSIPPNNAGIWLEAGIHADHILKWKTLLPDPPSAGTFSQENFSPEEALEWYDLGANAIEASTFRTGGWNPNTVANWLHTNHLTYCCNQVSRLAC
ncbi:hypothetical protein DSO57_1017943 [Entomophthora muscae]|uniref:Uncharacterized protein n=1 Tax=Entomophthora muscae TaxID=34485 RepID=A0ACC2TRJ1_9FUNG|nr:hypothetical protein DSO57_1017943 [Entomophthora muscae]